MSDTTCKYCRGGWIETRKRVTVGANGYIIDYVKCNMCNGTGRKNWVGVGVNGRPGRWFLQAK